MRTAPRPAPFRLRLDDSRRLAELVIHLARRQLESQHRFTLLGWLWPLVRQLAQLIVLVVLFSHVLHLGIKNFPAFVFSGLIVWTWFSAGVLSATSAIVGGRHLLFTARFPPATLPLVAVVVPLIDALAALPILLVMVAVTSGLHPTVLLVPLVLIVEFGITAGLALIVAALNVYFRDVQNGVGVALLLLFYLTPVFYGLKNLPPKFEVFLRANPLTAVVGSIRAVILEGTLPPLRDAAISCSAAVVLLVVGWYVFRRLQPDFLDEL